MTDLEDLDRLLLARLDAIGPAPRAVLLHVLMLPDHERARRIGEFYDDPMTQTFAKLLIHIEESPHSRALVLGELRSGNSAASPEGRRCNKSAEAELSSQQGAASN